MRSLKVAVIGGGSSYTPELVEGFIKRADHLPVRELWLVDVPAGQTKVEVVADLARRMLRAQGLSTTVRVSLERPAALEGADLVITQFRAGGLAGRAKDERIPLQHGLIGQETTGAGGFAYALRSIPVILAVAADMQALCPDAWLINFTNPAGLVTEAVLRCSRIRAAGLCNIPIGLVHGVARQLNVPSQEVEIEFAGLNHLSFARCIRVAGRDVTRAVLSLDDPQAMAENPLTKSWDPALLEQLQMLPGPYLAYYYSTEQKLAEQREAARTTGTRAEVVARLEKALFERYRDPHLQSKPPELDQRGGAWYSEAAVALADAIVNHLGQVHVVNVRGAGALPDLPPQAVIETAAYVDGSGCRPLPQPPLPAVVRGLVQSVKAFEELAVAAAIEGSRTLAEQALLAHPLVGRPAVARAVLRDLLEAHRADLPQFFGQ